MKIEVSDYFKKDYRSAYLFANNRGRNCVELIHNNSTKSKPIKRFISYAKYLWISEHKQEVPLGYEIDHINGDGKDDRIENLQLLTKAENIKKGWKEKKRLGLEVVDLVCPICGKTFTKRMVLVRRISSQPVCCSRSCSGKLSWRHIDFDRKSYIEDCENRKYKKDRDLVDKSY